MLSTLKDTPVRIWLLYIAIFFVLCAICFRIYGINATYDRVQETAGNNYSGQADSDKIIVEFLDYRCAFCRNLHPMVQDLVARNPDIKVVYRYYPIFGEKSILEGNMALTAGRQGHDKFIRMHNYLAKQQMPIDNTDAAFAIADNMGLDVEQFKSELYDEVALNYNLATYDFAKILKINSTPTFLIGRTVLTPDGITPTVEDLEKIIKDEYGQ